MDWHDGQLGYRVEDDRVGFDLAQWASGNSRTSRLTFIHERAMNSHGSVPIHSAPDKDTQMSVQVPLQVLLHITVREEHA